MTISTTPESTRFLSYGKALYEAAQQEMTRDPTVFIYGQGVDDHLGMYGTTLDLHKSFGAERCFDVPLSEDAMSGIGIGAALGGLRPINVHQRMDFLLLCVNQLLNIAAKNSYTYAGAMGVPLVIRGIIGRSWGQGSQHSQALHSMFMHVPGIKVIAPTTPYDAKGALIAAIRDPNPVLIVEHRMLYNNTGHVPEELYALPFGQARVLGEGADVTIVAISHMVIEALRARTHLLDKGVNAEVIDPVSLVPLDMETIATSVEKTGKLLVVDNGWVQCGAGAEIVAQTMERLQGRREIKVARMGFAPIPCPTTKPLENLFYPNGRTIASKAFDLVQGSPSGWTPPEGEEAREIKEFKGPF
jgi:acetoin:2,6-dichlorophenolindophenol oxidoreductase subunit beta